MLQTEVENFSTFLGIQLVKKNTCVLPHLSICFRFRLSSSLAVKSCVKNSSKLQFLLGGFFFVSFFFSPPSPLIHELLTEIKKAFHPERIYQNKRSLLELTCS